MKTILLLSATFSYTEGQCVRVVGGFATQAMANAKMEELSGMVSDTLPLHHQYEKEVEAWVDAHPRPTNAYQEYEAAKGAAQKVAYDRMDDELKDTVGYDERSARYDALMLEWEDAHRHLHWRVVEGNWRDSLQTYIQSLASYKAYTEAWGALQECIGGTPDTFTHFTPSDLSFTITPIPYQEVE
jgi:hypothetical protein